MIRQIKHHQKAQLLFWSLAMLISASIGNAGVNYKNGNFNTSGNDLIFPGDAHVLAINRTYNSQSKETGWFGIGWGSIYETFYKVHADGAIIIYEHGSGQETRYLPVNKQIDNEGEAKKIMDMIKKKFSIAKEFESKMFNRLKQDDLLRRIYSKELKIEGKIEPGQVYISYDLGTKYIVNTLAAGIVRIAIDGHKEYFGANGKLSKIDEGGGYNIFFNYEFDQLRSISDTLKKEIFFEWYPDHLVKAVWTNLDSKKKATYVYAGKELVEVHDILGGVYKYKYDNFHNLLEITFPSEQKTIITYDRKMGYATSVKGRFGDETHFEYGADSKQPLLKYWVTEKKIIEGTKPIIEKHIYEHKRRQDGSLQDYKYTIEKGNDYRKVTTFDPVTGNPQSVTDNYNKLNIIYDSKGRVLEKKYANGEFMKYTYNDKINKLESVTNKHGHTKYSYSQLGELEEAHSSWGHSVLIIYNSQRRISRFMDVIDGKNKRILTFEFNDLGRPTMVQLDNYGKVVMTYDNLGNLTSTTSEAMDASGKKNKADKKVVMKKVFEVMNTLLEIVKPAGIVLDI